MNVYYNPLDKKCKSITGGIKRNENLIINVLGDDDEPCLFVFGERFALLGLVGGQYDLFHGRGDIIILGSHVEDAMQHEREFLRLAVFVFAHDAEEIVL